MTQQVNTEAVQAGILESTMGRREYRRLKKKYGHETIWRAFSRATEALSTPHIGWKLRLFHMVRRTTERLERVQRWLEAKS